MSARRSLSIAVCRHRVVKVACRHSRRVSVRRGHRQSAAEQWRQSRGGRVVTHAARRAAARRGGRQGRCDHVGLVAIQSRQFSWMCVPKLLMLDTIHTKPDCTDCVDLLSSFRRLSMQCTNSECLSRAPRMFSTAILNLSLQTPIAPFSPLADTRRARGTSKLASARRR